MVLKRLLWVVLLFAGSSSAIIDHNDAQSSGTAQAFEGTEPAASFMIVGGLALIGLGRVGAGRR
jgi:hypothetical protein